MAGATRLGKQHLGRYAYEEQMPPRIAALLTAEDDANALSGVVPKLAVLLRRDASVQTAVLCTERAVQVYRLRREGNHFCGYRNIQMLAMAIDMKVSTCAKPSIPDLQSAIEKAWDCGYNSHARDQTGGIVGTRKHIGTSEAEALLLSEGIACTGVAFSGENAWTELFDAVEKYFSPNERLLSGVHLFNRAPIFLQRPSHSITIIGIERLRSGQRRLLAFDPAWNPPSAMASSSSDMPGNISKWSLRLLLGRYRKGERYFRRYNAFEVLLVNT